MGGGGKRLLLLFLWPVLVLAQDETDSYGPRPKQAAAARQQFEKQLATHKDDKDKLVLPGLVADRQARTVEVLAEATGLNAEEIIEFLLVDQRSGHGYEALLWSFAKPSDVHRALEFIGLKPGSPIHPASGRFWSDGDPVMLSVRGEDGKLVPIEEFILDRQTGKTLPVEGFVFAGSVRLPAKGEEPERYAADVYEPRSIASIFNEPVAVLDVPRQVSQSEVYGSQVVNPEQMLEGGKLWTVVMRPGVAAGQRRGRQVQLAVKPAPGNTGLEFRLTEEGEKIIEKSSEPTPVLEALVALKQAGAAPYVTLAFDEALPVTEVGKTCILMAMLEGMLRAVRINPPAAGQLYYRAFVPDREWRDPQRRPVQPWELHLSKTNASIAAQLVRYDPAPSFQRHAHPVADPAGMKERMETESRERRQTDRAQLPPVLLVYAGADLTYGDVLKFVRPVLPTHRTVYVFVEEK